MSMEDSSFDSADTATGLCVFVCRGVTCSNFFAQDVYREFRRIVAKLDLREVRVDRGGCYARCGGGVTVMIRRDGNEENVAEGICYPEVMEPDVERIAREHLRGRRPIEELQIARHGAKAPIKPKAR